MELSDLMTTEEILAAQSLPKEERFRQALFRAGEFFKKDYFDACHLRPRDKKDALPGFVSDFMDQMHCINFDRMLPASRRLLWIGVLLSCNLTKSEFPYPEKLERLDNQEKEGALVLDEEDYEEIPVGDPVLGVARKNGKERIRLVIARSVLVAFCLLFLGFLAVHYRHLLPVLGQAVVGQQHSTVPTGSELEKSFLHNQQDLRMAPFVPGNESK